MYAIKLPATKNPYKAGTKSPNFFTAGENTAGKVNTIDIKPIMQMNVMMPGLFTINEKLKIEN